MAITKALMYSRVSSSVSTGTGLYKKMRVAATRLNYFGPKVLCTVNGTVRSYNFDRTNWSVTQRRRGQPATLTIEFSGFTPTLGHEIILGAGSLSNRLFRGKITGITQVRLRQNEGRIVYHCTCLDWGYLVDGIRNVSGKFTSSSGSTIAASLFSTYGPAGFTATHVQSGLATIDEIQFTMQSLNEALQQLCDRLGAYFYWDYEKDLHLFTADTSGVPAESLTSTNKHVHRFTYKSDIEDLRNRIYVEGKGSAATLAMAAASTTLPLQDVSMFDASGGSAKLEAQTIAYTSKSALTTGSAVAGIPQNPSAPSGAIASGQSGHVTGVVSYKLAHRMPTGDSEPSTASSDVTIAVISAPSSAPTVAVSTSTDGGVTPGARKYKVSYVTSAGETLAGTASSTATITAVGEASFCSTSPTTGGSMALGSYYYFVTFVTAAGTETMGLYPTPATLTGVQNAVSLSSIPTSADGRVTKRKIYRTKVGGVANTALLLTTINDNSTTTYSDTTADGSLGATPVPLVNTTGGQTALTSIPTSGDARVTARKIYRTEASSGGFTIYRFLATIGDNSTTTYTDATRDTELGDAEPAADTSGGGVVTVTISVGPSGTTARRLYRTAAGGSVWKYLGSVNDNVTTTYTDSKDDDGLGDDAPAASAVRTEAGSTSLRVLNVGMFPTAGWIIVDGQVVFFGSRALSGEGYLTDVPASGLGAILAPLSAGSTVLNAPHLTGVTGLSYAITPGDSVNLLTTRNDATSQSTYGMRQLFVQDRRLGLDGAADRGDAELALRKDPRISGTFDSSDPKLHAGAPVTINNWGLSQSVVVEQITIAPRPDRPQPMVSVQFASRTIEDFYAALREVKDRLNH